jgi:N6-adenosine-specific RNA methylase IME4
VRLVSPSDEVEHLLRAAMQRRHLSTSQRAALVVRLAEYRQASAEATSRRLANLRPEVAKLPPGGKTRALGAALAGVGERTIQDAQTVLDDDPSLFERLVAGEISAHKAANHVRRKRKLASLPPTPALPDGMFDVLYADPPWPSQTPDSEWAPESHYPTMAIEEIKALAAPAAEDALLFLWAINSLLPEALAVMAAWGFEYRTNLTWVKDSIGLGFWARNRHELLLLGRRGEFPLADAADRPDSVIEARRGRHSEKPACVYELIERMYPSASRLELFARTSRSGWTAWGKEVAA